MNLKKDVQQKLHKIEKDYKVKVLFASLSGSRAQGRQSIDSDYDVKFIFLRPFQERVRFNKQPETIHEGNSEENSIELTGFELEKTLKLLYARNTEVINIIRSPVLLSSTKVYSDLKTLSTACSDSKKTFVHYIYYNNTKNPLQALALKLSACFVKEYGYSCLVNIPVLLSCFSDEQLGQFCKEGSYKEFAKRVLSELKTWNQSTREENSKKKLTEIKEFLAAIDPYLVEEAKKLDLSFNEEEAEALKTKLEEYLIDSLTEEFHSRK